MPEKASEGRESSSDRIECHQRSAELDDPRPEAVHVRSQYLLDNKRKEAADRFAALALATRTPATGKQEF